MLQTELQQDIERFHGQHMARMREALYPLTEAEEPELRKAAIQNLLMHNATSLDIAAGALPEINILDMVVYVALSRAVADRYWVPEIFGPRGRPLVEALAESDRSVSEIEGKVLGPAQQRDLDEVIHSWLEANPQQIVVDSVRFSEFSRRAGEVSEERAREAAGLLKSVRLATKAADEALLLAERGIFLANNVPSVIRLQARLGAYEMLDDSLQQLAHAQALLDQAERLRPMLGDTAELVRTSDAALKEANQLTKTLEPVLQLLVSEVQLARAQTEPYGLEKTLGNANRLASTTLSILRETRELTPADPEQTFAAIERRVDRIVRRWIGYVVVLGAAWALFFWGGYLIVKRFTTGRAPSTPAAAETRVADFRNASSAGPTPPSARG